VADIVAQLGKQVMVMDVKVSKDRIAEALEFLDLAIEQGCKTKELRWRAIETFHRNYIAVERIGLGKLIADFHTLRATDKTIGEGRRKASKVELARVETFFGGSFPAADLGMLDWLRFFEQGATGQDGQPLSEGSKIKSYNHINTLLNKAVKMEWIPTNHLAKIERDSLGEYGENKDFYSVADCQWLLATTYAGEEFRQTLFPWLVIGLFTGMRGGESCFNPEKGDALKWSDIALYSDHPCIHVRKAFGKGKKEGWIDAPYAIEALRAWVPLIERNESPYVCATYTQVQEAKKRFLKLTGKTFPDLEGVQRAAFHHNGLRNTFATYANAYDGKEGLERVSKQLRNTPAVCERYYVKTLPAGSGKAFFDLRPTSEMEALSKVIQLPQAA
jgi:hypothetical protein